jgi:hypothetical protein
MVMWIGLNWLVIIQLQSSFVSRFKHFCYTRRELVQTVTSKVCYRKVT